MPFVQVGPQKYLDERIVRHYGIPRYAPPQAATKAGAAVVRAAAKKAPPPRQAAHAPVKTPALRVAPRRQSAAERAKTIPEAMAAGLNNTQISQRLSSGRLQDIRTVDAALRAWWKPDEVREAQRRGFIF